MKKINGSGDEQRKDLTCGIVMPISALDGLAGEHWTEVFGIIKEAVEAIREESFEVRLVSDSDEVGVIQKRIVQSLYNAPIVICDVSGKNPNVMFELGMRLAFDKPTVIIKDDKTDYSFDTGIIEHLSYPRDLRFRRIVEFKKTLGEKVFATYRAGQKDPNHSPFLKNFGSFTVASLDQTEVPLGKAVLEMLSNMQRNMTVLMSRSREKGLADSNPVAMRLAEVAVQNWIAQGKPVPPTMNELLDFIIAEHGQVVKLIEPEQLNDLLIRLLKHIPARPDSN